MIRFYRSEVDYRECMIHSEFVVNRSVLLTFQSALQLTCEQTLACKYERYVGYSGRASLRNGFWCQGAAIRKRRYAVLTNRLSNLVAGGGLEPPTFGL